MAKRGSDASIEGRACTHFARACAALAPMRSGARLLLGCSAGGDSLALARLAAAAAEARGWALAIAHFDHAQRPESAAEAQFVAGCAAALGLPCIVERLGCEAESALAPALSEDALRRARHDFFRRAAAQWHAEAVALAHHADDQAETLLIRLLAGSGPTGLAGMRPVQRLAGGLVLVRPLLGFRRAELREYLGALGQPWHEDPSNAATDTKRGWVRHAMLPAIARGLDLDAVPRLARAAGLIGDEAAVLEEVMGVMLKELALPAEPPVLARLALDHATWRGASARLRRQLLRVWLAGLRAGEHPPGLAAVEEALSFAERGEPGSELRTVGRMHIMHCKTSLAAFAREVPEEARHAAAAPLRPAKPEKRPKRTTG